MSFNREDNFLNEANKGVDKARGVLAVLFRQLLAVRGIDPWRWDMLIRDYLADPRNGIPNNSRDRSSARGNLNKELFRPDMTWRVFLKAMNFLNLVRVSFTVKVQWNDGTVSEVTARLKDRARFSQTSDLPPVVNDLDKPALPRLPAIPRPERAPTPQMDLPMPGLGGPGEERDEEDEDLDENDEVEESSVTHDRPFLLRR
ncbi:hypothetical protein LUCX_332 [Xanthomonas phage vB_XciM_LucasX]|nr:hypothetical protein LUCX_332 [Xanthomonas phage vB_XciM_LucasX]